ncbi:MAG: metallophosphoesterase [Defluviitaleaceae bacterium]|nr:metallophosphoesterase [Defluviitaleaceae bacterium]
MAWRLHVHFDAIGLWVFRGAVIGMVVIILAMFGLVFKFQNPVIRIIGIFAGYMAVFMPYLTFAMAISHILVMLWDISLFWSGIGAVAAAFIITLIGAILGNILVIRKTNIAIPNMPKQLRIMQITDVHIGILYGKKYLAKIVEATNRHNPDIVVITGDLTETNGAIKYQMLTPLQNLTVPTYFVPGNHESFPGLAGVLDTIAAQNVRVLINEVVETHGIQLVGLDYMRADETAFDMHRIDNQKTVKSVLAKMPLKREIPAIVLSHNPTGVNYAKAAGADLMISGHTHRGQVFPFSIITKLAFPYHGGLYENGGIKVFVSGGAGGVMARMRLGSRNEINLLTLIRQ